MKPDFEIHYTRNGEQQVRGNNNNLSDARGWAEHLSRDTGGEATVYKRDHQTGSLTKDRSYNEK